MYNDYNRPQDDWTQNPYFTNPNPSSPPPPPPRKKRGGGLKVVVLCLVCALIGGAAATAAPRIMPMVFPEKTTIYHSDRVVTEVESVKIDGRTQMSLSQVYSANLPSVVGVNGNVNTNYWGQTVSNPVAGSGFVITADGYILTNYHVIENAYEGNLDVSVMLYDGTTYTATIVGTEPDNDIAVLKIEAEGLNAAELADSDELLVGDKVYAVGNPLGELEFSMTTGYVSAKDRVIATGQGSDAISMFQFDAAVNSGNSGGPVYNELGQVVGVVTAKYADTGVEGIGFAVPISDAAAIANDLITKGYVTGKAYLGVTINTNYNNMYAQYYGWPLGAYVDDVSAGSCAEKAGIVPGDIITKMGGEEIKSYDDLKSAIKRHSAGESVEVELYRADESRVVTVIFDESVPESA